YFFFQAEDGIRDRNVTGVQTCALPICTTITAAPVNRQPAALPHTGIFPSPLTTVTAWMSETRTTAWSWACSTSTGATAALSAGQDRKSVVQAERRAAAGCADRRS